MSVYFSSDWHWGHKRIREYEPSRPEGFEWLVARKHQEIIQPEDTWWFLGDLVLGNASERAACAREVSKIRGRKLMVCGNHDNRSPDAFFLNDCGFSRVFRTSAWVGDGVLLTHFPIAKTVPFDGRYVREREILRDYFRTNKGKWNVHGHVHSKTTDHPKCINVSIEVTNFGPMELFRERS